MIEGLVNIFFPKTCPMCGKVIKKKLICDNCNEKMTVIREPKCEKCGKPLDTNEKIYCEDCGKRQHFFTRGVALFEHTGDLRESVYKFKFGNAREYGEFYGQTAAKQYKNVFRAWNIQIMIPIPMYYKKEIKRGYNQAEVFANCVSKYTGIPVDKKSLIRKKPTVAQKELNDEMRRANLEGAFAVDASRVSSYKSVLLVDDIYTTGSTVDACAKLLKKAGVDKVYVLCISIGRDEEKFAE